MNFLLIREGAWKVFAFCDSQGRCDVQVFLAELKEQDADDHARLERQLTELANYGPSLRNRTKFRPLGDGVYEIKTAKARRVYYFFGHNACVAVCTHGVKKRAGKGRVNEDKAKVLHIQAEYLEWLKQGGRLE